MMQHVRLVCEILDLGKLRTTLKRRTILRQDTLDTKIVENEAVAAVGSCFQKGVPGRHGFKLRF